MKFNFQNIWSAIAIGSVTAATVLTNTPPIAALASISGIIFVVGIAFAWKHSNAFGAILAACLAYLSYQAGFYSNVVVQGAFVLPASLWGWWYWCQTAKGNITAKHAPLSSKQWGALCAVGVISFAAALWFSVSQGAALPIMDAATLTLPILGTILLIKACREQWIVWNVSNAIQAYMWWMATTVTSAGFFSLAVMKTVFLANSIIGAYLWFKKDTK